MKNWIEEIERYTDYGLYERGFSPSKTRAYKKLFVNLSKRLSLPLNLKAVRSEILRLKRQGRSASYIHYIITAINSFVRWRREADLPQEDITATLNKLRPKVDRKPDANDLLSVTEIRLLLTPPPRRINPKMGNLVAGMERRYEQVDGMYNLLFELVYKTGCRIGEAVKLRKKDFNFPNHSVTFYGTKTGDNRHVGIPPDMDNRLQEYVEPLNDTDYLFVGTHTAGNRKHIIPDMANDALRRRARYHRIKRRIHIHQFRHSCITHMLINGAPISVVQDIVGHKRLATTQLYTHVNTENQRKAMATYNPLIRASGDQEFDFRRTKEMMAEMVRLLKESKLKYQFIEKPRRLAIEVGW